jgi:hypothetical protein
MPITPYFTPEVSLVEYAFEVAERTNRHQQLQRLAAWVATHDVVHVRVDGDAVVIGCHATIRETPSDPVRVLTLVDRVRTLRQAQDVLGY